MFTFILVRSPSNVTCFDYRCDVLKRDVRIHTKINRSNVAHVRCDWVRYLSSVSLCDIWFQLSRSVKEDIMCTHAMETPEV